MSDQANGHPVEVEEFTIDELARRANMTVRNVRAYAGRGLIAPPRLAGRTGYYTQLHLQRLQLVRQLLDRGFTLAAVEDAVLNSPGSAAGHALDLISLLGEPADSPDTIMTRAELAALAGTEPEDLLIDALSELGLAEPLDDGSLSISNPALVRAGAAARSLGLSSEAIIAIFPVLEENLRTIAAVVVNYVSDDVVQPFIDAGMPEDDWSPVFSSVEALIPIASQSVLAAFRPQLTKAIEQQITLKLAEMAEQSNASSV